MGFVMLISTRIVLLVAGGQAHEPRCPNAIGVKPKLHNALAVLAPLFLETMDIFYCMYRFVRHVPMVASHSLPRNTAPWAAYF